MHPPPILTATAAEPKPMAKTHLGLLNDVGELSASLAGSTNIKSFLQRIVELVASHLRSDVCSIYLYSQRTERLTLRVTRGLSADAVGRVQLRLGEGLVGTALQELRPICEKCASTNPNYRFFAETDEEHFEAFLAVPISRGSDRIGVLVVQRPEENAFTETDIMALKATASQLAGAIENARILISMHQEESEPAAEDLEEPAIKMVRGEVASDGYAHGPAIVLNRRLSSQLLNETVLTEQYTEEDFDRAIHETERQLENLQRDLAHKLPEMAALIFSAHVLMLKDDEFTGKMRQRIRGGTHPAGAILGVAREYIDLFSANANAFVREKAQDVEDLSRRLIGNLQQSLAEPGSQCSQHIVIADTLFPSDVLKLASEEVAGIVLVTGGVTSHVSILARSLQIPLMIAGNRRLLDLADGTRLVLDGFAGHLHIDPDDDILKRLRHRNNAREVANHARGEMQPTTITRDGQRITLFANINLLSDLEHATKLKAEGVGLYRSEFPFLVRTDFPTEEEQYPIYRTLVEQCAGSVLTFRTLDIGGDKVMAFFDDKSQQINPNLGMRSIRFSLHHRKLFHEQLRAFLRASIEHGGRRIRLMFPMISSIDEYLEARREVEICREQLVAEGITGIPEISIGIMVEVPSLIEILDDIAPLVDFFCIGTNDFIQFLVAVDRSNEKVAPYFQPYHPSVLRSLKRIADAAARHGIQVSICGEMAHEVRYIPFLIGIGIRTLSVDPRYLPTIQKQLQQIDTGEARQQAERILSLSRIDELRRCFEPTPSTESDSPCAADSP